MGQGTASSLAPYEHRFHVGNVGDVLKHVALVALLEAVAGPRHYLETHAGAGRYKLGERGEWQGGVARLFEAVERAPAAAVPPQVARYLALVRTVGIWKAQGKVYPGSPNLAQALLREAADRIELYDLAEAACASLRDKIQGPQIQVEQADGLAALAPRLAALGAVTPLVLIDPPYSDRAEWSAVVEAIAAAHRACPRAALVLWYPVISLSRPNALFAGLERAGVAATAVELVTTPLELKRRGLNGSGLVFAGALPEGLVAGVLAALPFVGAACATQAGQWSMRARAWGPAGADAA